MTSLGAEPHDSCNHVDSAGNTGHYFADVRVRLRLLNVADSAVMLLP